MGVRQSRRRSTEVRAVVSDTCKHCDSNDPVDVSNHRRVAGSLGVAATTIFDHMTSPPALKKRPQSSSGNSLSRYWRSLTSLLVIEFASVTERMSVLSVPSRISIRTFSKQSGSVLEEHKELTVQLLG